MEHNTNSEQVLIFELSGEHEALPKAEIAACLEVQGVDYTILKEDLGTFIVRSRGMNLKELKSRLALSHYIDSHLFSFEAEELETLSTTFEIGGGSFAVRAKRLQSSHGNIDLKLLEKRIADLMEGDNPVDLTNPEIEVRVIVAKSCHVGLRLEKIPRRSFEARKVKNRPYFSPVSLHPRHARALVNLSRVREGEVLLDPFCGTGGVLMEASLVGARPLGSDIDGKMVKGCRENLQNLKMSDVEVFKADVSEVLNRIGQVDAVATDPPYGKAATTNKEEISKLYTRAFKMFSEVLRPGGYAVVVIPQEHLIQIGREHLSLKESYAMRVHKSLTRNFCVFRK